MACNSRWPAADGPGECAAPFPPGLTGGRTPPSGTRPVPYGLAQVALWHSANRPYTGYHIPGLPAPKEFNVSQTGTWAVKVGLAQMLKGGVIMDVVTPEHAKIAEEAGACAVMALERVPSDIRKDGGVARMSDPEMIDGIINAVTIPVMAKARIGHFVEAEVLQALGIDYIDESEVLTPADEAHHIDKHTFKVPFVCGCRNLGEALRRIGEGAAMIRTKGEAGTGDIVEAVRHMRTVQDEIRRLQTLADDEIYTAAKELGAPLALVQQVKREGRLPVVNFAAGGVATPADAALMMRLGADGVFVGSGIFKSENPPLVAKAIVEATTHYQDADVIARVSRGLGKAMPGIAVSSLAEKELLATRGW
ncbi:MAG: pyridoxal 5'-phosphate synthase lyase subunit PdxS [Dehalococcoidia bacterium]|nr:pyridoxal 5'-phosphate synthase lyase subunit PdxS [Dehalococcoidia bacterium]